MLVSLLLSISLFLFLSKEHEKQDNGLHHSSDGKFFREESASEPGAVHGLEIHSGRNFGLRVFHWKMSQQI